MPFQSDGWSVTFSEMQFSEGAFHGQIDGATWNHCPVLIQPFSTATNAPEISPESLSYRPADALAASARAFALANPKSSPLSPQPMRTVLSWMCNRCGVTREPDSPDPAKCSRLQVRSHSDWDWDWAHSDCEV